ncbi:MAG TPA: hypothetical protein DCS91_12060 [Microcoleaceae bacterium UBA11344]|nr:hypothetical protein [Microcoleaceae cyanobacterium UBA11344]
MAKERQQANVPHRYIPATLLLMELSYLAILLEHFDYALLPFSARLAGQSPSRHDRALGKLPSCPIG